MKYSLGRADVKGNKLEAGYGSQQEKAFKKSHNKNNFNI